MGSWKEKLQGWAAARNVLIVLKALNNLTVLMRDALGCPRCWRKSHPYSRSCSDTSFPSVPLGKKGVFNT